MSIEFEKLPKTNSSFYDTGSLLADFQSIKGEIARRSGLQETVYALTITAQAFLIWSQISNPERISPVQYLLLSTLITVLSKLSFTREKFEIFRLGDLIKKIEQISIQKSNGPYFYFISEVGFNDSNQGLRKCLNSTFHFIIWYLPILLYAVWFLMRSRALI